MSFFEKNFEFHNIFRVHELFYFQRDYICISIHESFLSFFKKQKILGCIIIFAGQGHHSRPSSLKIYSQINISITNTLVYSEYKERRPISTYTTNNQP